MPKGKGPFLSHVATGLFGEVLAHPSEAYRGLKYMTLARDHPGYLRAIVISAPTNRTAIVDEVGQVTTIGTDGWIIEDD
jgi:hypothetical protein